MECPIGEHNPYQRVSGKSMVCMKGSILVPLKCQNVVAMCAWALALPKRTGLDLDLDCQLSPPRTTLNHGRNCLGRYFVCFFVIAKRASCRSSHF